MTNKTELLQKLRALALGGVGGEKENASAMLTRLMKKYSITEQELDDEMPEIEEFKYRNKIQRKILLQTIFKVTNSSDMYDFKNRRNTCGAECTKAQKIEIEFLFDFYTQLWEREQKALLTAFIQKHKIFGECEAGGEDKISAEECRKIRALMNGLSDETPVKRLEAAD